MAWVVRRHRRAARDEVVAFQEVQLRRLVANAYENVPYYRSLAGAGDGPRRTYTGTKLATADTAKGSLRGTAPVDPTMLHLMNRDEGVRR
jgi:hypothetical protein